MNNSAGKSLTPVRERVFAHLRQRVISEPVTVCIGEGEHAMESPKPQQVHALTRIDRILNGEPDHLMPCSLLREKFLGEGQKMNQEEVKLVIQGNPLTDPASIGKAKRAC